MRERGNLFEGIGSGPTGEGEWFDPILQSGATRIERIVSHGHCSKEGFWYEQEEAEWVLVVGGRARLRLQNPDESAELGPGEWYYIEAMRKHRVEWTTPDEPTVWLAVWVES